MCNQYSPSDPHIVALHFKVEPPAEAYKRGLGPWGRAPFVRSARAGREAVVGQWALIGDNAREAKSSARIMTDNARSESVATKPTFRGPWQSPRRPVLLKIKPHGPTTATRPAVEAATNARLPNAQCLAGMAPCATLKCTRSGSAGDYWLIAAEWFLRGLLLISFAREMPGSVPLRSRLRALQHSGHRRNGRARQVV